MVNFTSLPWVILEIHAIAAGLLVLDHIEIIRAQAEWFQDTVSKLCAP